MKTLRLEDFKGLLVPLRDNCFLFWRNHSSKLHHFPSDPCMQRQKIIPLTANDDCPESPSMIHLGFNGPSTLKDAGLEHQLYPFPEGQFPCPSTSSTQWAHCLRSASHKSPKTSAEMPGHTQSLVLCTSSPWSQVCNMGASWPKAK